MNMYGLISRIRAAQFEFTYPHAVNMESKFVKLNGKKIGYYRILKTEMGEGLCFKFENHQFAQYLATIGQSGGAEVHHSAFLGSVIIYPTHPKI